MVDAIARKYLIVRFLVHLLLIISQFFEGSHPNLAPAGLFWNLAARRCCALPLLARNCWMHAPRDARGWREFWKVSVIFIITRDTLIITFNSYRENYSVLFVAVVFTILTHSFLFVTGNSTK